MRDNNFEEYKTSIHYQNPSGVRAECADCHVPQSGWPRYQAKLAAYKDLISEFVGTIDTREKFQAHRLEMAQTVWDNMKQTDSRECRSCHSYEAMDFVHQKNQESAKVMKVGLESGQTCIDCHKGIAHELPDMASGYKARFEKLVTNAKSLKPNVGATFYTLNTTPFWLEQPSDTSASADGKLLAATPVEVLSANGQWLKVKFSGWQQEGAERMFYAKQGKRIFVAALAPKAVAKVVPGASMVDPDTEQKWTESSLEGWIENANLTTDISELWAYGSEMFSASCALCHALPPTGHYLANQWIGTLNSMKRNISLDDEQYRLLQKYVQMHAQDTGSGHGEGAESKR
jgi:trimethylamine-N-oxide reductase cytochrome c-type subunit TorC